LRKTPRDHLHDIEGRPTVCFMKKYTYLIPVLAIAGCTSLTPPAAVDPVVPPVDTPTPTLDTTPPPPPSTSATTVEQFDTTTAEDREEAQVVQASASDASLGTTIASLGSPTEPGIWLKTPLVSTLTEGRIAYQGKEINVELRPSGGAAGSGSQISLAAIRLIEAPLTGLPEIEVFAR